MLKIDKNSKLPLHFQIYENIKEQIENNRLNPGDLLHSETELQELYDVSRITIRRAIQDLANDGYVVKKRGKGTFVKETKYRHELRQLTSFSEDIKRYGEISRSMIRDFKILPASESLAKLFQIRQGEDVYYLERIRMSGDFIIGLHRAYLKKSDVLVLDVSEFTETTSLYETLRNKGIDLKNADEVLEARMPEKEIADVLKIKGNIPIFYKERTTFDSTGVPVEFVEMYYRADVYQYKVRLNMESDI